MDKYTTQAGHTNPAPPDIPTFYKRGPDSAYHRQAPSTSAPSISSLTTGSVLNHNLPSRSLGSSSPLSFEPFEESMAYDEDMGASQYTEWTQWDDTDCHLDPPMTSIEYTPPMPNDPEFHSSGRHAQQYDLCGPASPQCPSDCYYEHVPPPYLQPHMHNRTPAVTTSTLHQTSLPHLNTVSPYASSGSSSSSPSPLSTPEITIRTPITLHQPRPSRRIPIVSLSELASACDDFSTSPTSRDAPFQKPSRELLSPLSADIPVKYQSPYSPLYPLFSDEMGFDGTTFPVPFAPEEKNAYTAPTRVFNDSEEMVMCSCGCGRSYIIQQNSH